MQLASTPQISRHVLIVDSGLNGNGHATAATRGVRALATELHGRGMEVIESTSCEDGMATASSDASIDCILINWTQGTHENDLKVHTRGHRAAARRCAAQFASADLPDGEPQARGHCQRRGRDSSPTNSSGFPEDTAPFIAGRVSAADRALLENSCCRRTPRRWPRYNREREYSWAAPGHQGGVAFLKSPVGRVFFDFFGENLFRTDMGIERGALGSLLGHSGPVGESERYAARVFGAHRSYTVLNGTSASNRTIMSACVGDGEIALCDRNCHKSIEQGLALTGGIPVFLTPDAQPLRHHRPDPARSSSSRRPSRRRIADEPAGARRRGASAPSTPCSPTAPTTACATTRRRCEERLAQSVDRIHFDEAWYGYARFNPLYRNRFAMRGDPETHPKDGPTVFATHSTHKLLAALSQTSFIHIRDGRGAIDHGRFNEAYCTQATHLAAVPADRLERRRRRDDGRPRRPGADAGDASTRPSPAAWPRRAFTRNSRPRRSGSSRRGTHPRSSDPKSGKKVPFHEALRRAARDRPGLLGAASGRELAWLRRHCPTAGACSIPIKFGIVCPGMQDDGQLAEHGIPADIVTAYLGRHGIVPSRTTDHMVLFLFSMGVTKGKWGTLLNTLLDFKADYDRNAPLAEVLPQIAAAAPRALRRHGPQGSRRRDVGSTCARAGRATGRRRPTPRCPSRR